MKIISGMYGNYIQFRDEDEAKTFAENIQAMINRNETPLVFGWGPDDVCVDDFDKEYAEVKGLFENEIVQAIRQRLSHPLEKLLVSLAGLQQK
jgi:hypothetical protein